MDYIILVCGVIILFILSFFSVSSILVGVIILITIGGALYYRIRIRKRQVYRYQWGLLQVILICIIIYFGILITKGKAIYYLFLPLVSYIVLTIFTVLYIFIDIKYFGKRGKK